MTTPELPGAGSQQPSPHHPQQQYAQGPGVPTYTLPAQPNDSKKQLNVVGLIALITAVLGFIFSCVPGALIVGWVLLPIAFILAIVSLFLKDKAKWMGITALITSVVGTIVGVIVFTAVVATSFDNAFGSGDTKVVAPSNDGTAEAGAGAGAETDASANAGTRESPYPVGSVIESKDWRVVINSVTLAATDAVMSANQFNDAPTPGSEYVLVNYSATYTGDDADGQMPVFVSVEYVTADGITVDGTKQIAVAPEAIDNMSTLYKGATATGNKAFEVPSATAGQGVLAIRPGMFGDKVFVATK